MHTLIAVITLNPATKIYIIRDMERFSTESSDDNLEPDDYHNNYEEKRRSTQSFEDVEFVIEFSRVKEIEYLHQDKRVENHRKMP